jgi:hypothetical protein
MLPHVICMSDQHESIASLAVALRTYSWEVSEGGLADRIMSRVPAEVDVWVAGQDKEEYSMTFLIGRWYCICRM